MSKNTNNKDSLIKEMIDETRLVISLYPTVYNGKPFLLPVGWTEAMCDYLSKHLESSLSKAYEEGYKEGIDIACVDTRSIKSEYGKAN